MWFGSPCTFFTMLNACIILYLQNSIPSHICSPCSVQIMSLSWSSITKEARRSSKKKFFLIPISLHIDYIVDRSLTTYRRWSPMLRFVYENIKVYSVWERRVHSTKANTLCVVQNVHCNFWTFWGNHVQPGVSVLYDDWQWPLCMHYTLCRCNSNINPYLWNLIFQAFDFSNFKIKSVQINNFSRFVVYNIFSNNSSFIR